MTGTSATSRYGYSCSHCGEWFFAEAPSVSAPCPLCGGAVSYRGPVGQDGRVSHQEERLACNDLCQSARGVQCDCQCGGANHGIRRTVTVTVVDGTPRFGLTDALSAAARRRLPEVEAAERLVSEVRDLVETRYGRVLARKRSGGYLSHEDYASWRRGLATLDDLKRYAGYKVPSQRVRSLTELRDSLAAETPAPTPSPSLAFSGSRRPNRYAGKCKTGTLGSGCGRWVEAEAGFLHKDEAGAWAAICPRCAAGETPAATPSPSAGPSPSPESPRPAAAPPAARTYELTEEQQEAVRLFLEGESFVIQAGAGTGKTSTLEAIARSTSRFGRFVAFNKDPVRDAAARMPGNVACSTAHKLAYDAVGRRFKHRLDSSERMRSDEIARRLGVGPLNVSLPDGTIKVLQPGQLAAQVTAGVTRFCHTADPAPEPKHIPYVEGIDLPAADGRRTYANNDRVREHLAAPLRRAWEDLQSPNGTLRFTPDHYFKIWALSHPVIPCDFLMVDEAQDTDPAFAAVIFEQQCQVILVGDAQQQMYDWRGAVDAMDEFPVETTTYLTMSWRFGAGIAAVANRVLERIPSAVIRLIGCGEAESSFGEEPEPAAVLARTNAGAIEAVIEATQAGRRAHLVGGNEEVRSFAKAAERLMQGLPTDHRELSCFSSWGEVQDYVAQDPLGGELKLWVKLIDTYGIETILRVVENRVPEADADVVVSTCHRAKGREWDSVRLAGDYPDPEKREMTDADLRVLYVAATRAKRHLDYSRCLALRVVLGETGEAAGDDEDGEEEVV